MTIDSLRTMHDPEGSLLSANDSRSTEEARTFGRQREDSAGSHRTNRAAWYVRMGRAIDRESWSNNAASTGGFGKLDGDTEKVRTCIRLGSLLFSSFIRDVSPLLGVFLGFICA